jgi:hypothetical protein
MRYRYAKLLLQGDEVVRKTDNVHLTVSSIQVFGQYKKVQITAIAANGCIDTIFNDEVE